LLSHLGAAHWFGGNRAEATDRTERGLEIAEALQHPEALCRGWNNRALVIASTRPEEARALLQLELETALAHELYDRASIACANLSDLGFQRDRYTESLTYLEQSLELARRIGDRPNESFALSEMSYVLAMLGRWEEAFDATAAIDPDQLGTNPGIASPLNGALELFLHRGEVDRARELLARYERLSESGDIQAEGGYRTALAAVKLVEGDVRGALAAAERAVERGQPTLGPRSQVVKFGLLHALEAALALGDDGKARELIDAVERVPAGLRSPFLAAIAHRFRARLVDDARAEAEFAAAASGLRELELPFYLALIQLEHAEWLLARGRTDEAAPLVAEALERFERLGAKPWVERVRAATRGVPVEVPA
jgi:tetratricopeptide (TPR) repeat protein